MPVDGVFFLLLLLLLLIADLFGSKMEGGIEISPK